MTSRFPLATPGTETQPRLIHAPILAAQAVRNLLIDYRNLGHDDEFAREDIRKLLGADAAAALLLPDHDPPAAGDDVDNG